MDLRSVIISHTYRRLRHTERHLFLALALISQPTPSTFGTRYYSLPTWPILMEITGLSLSSVQRAMTALRKAGFVLYDRQRGIASQIELLPPPC